VQTIRKAGLGARISVPAALAAGLAAPLLAMALAAPAWAATGPRMGSAGQTGFVVTGAQIRDVRGQVFGRNGAGFASTQAGIGGSLSLWAGGNRGTVILVGVSTGTGSAHQPWSPGINVYQDHKLIASQNDASVNGQTCTAAGACPAGDPPGAAQPPAEGALLLDLSRVDRHPRRSGPVPGPATGNGRRGPSLSCRPIRSGMCSVPRGRECDISNRQGVRGGGWKSTENGRHVRAG
jgi:hypothetical protein